MAGVFRAREEEIFLPEKSDWFRSLDFV